MPHIEVAVSTPISRSIRCRQVEAMFDVPSQETQTLEWRGDVPLDARPWNVGLIVGPSGAGKTTVAAELFGADAIAPRMSWGAPSVIEDFPAGSKLEEIAGICSAVGFNTIPAWLRPYNVLSNGEKFRVQLARTLLEAGELAVMDEFTSVVDRQVAKIGSHAVQKYVRKRGTRFVAVSCHYDIVEWLNPDWILEPGTMTFSWRELRGRPSVECEITKVSHESWQLFAPFHYLTRNLHKSARCYVLFYAGQPAAIGAMMFRPHPKVRNVWGLSRLVTLPDFQGLGLAFVLTDTLASAFKALGQKFHTYPAHPALVRSFDRSANWHLIKRPGINGSQRRWAAVPDGDGSRERLREARTVMGARPNAVFEWVGGEMDRAEARELLQIRSLQ